MNQTSLPVLVSLLGATVLLLPFADWCWARGFRRASVAATLTSAGTCTLAVLLGLYLLWLER
jgi:hypothetical protein